jgi:hypothetical protein
MKIGGIEFEVVKKTENRIGYIRKKPDRSNPTEKQLQNMLLFGKTAFDSYGQKEEGKELPPAAIAVREVFKENRVKEIENGMKELLEEKEMSDLLDLIEFSSAQEKIKLLQNL